MDIVNTAVDYKDAIRARDVSDGDRIIKKKEQTIAEQLVKKLGKQELQRILAMLDTKAFFDVCDVLRVINAVERTDKGYDHFPEDLVRIMKFIKVSLAKK
jgi:hypothetical protein